jgi:ribosome biogenesis GTPase / thiamine phosphate phosphatase
MSLADFGYEPVFAEAATQRAPGGHHAARVVAVDRERYVISDGERSVPAELTGRLLYAAGTREEIPCVGDWVLVDFFDADTHAIIHELLPRKSILRRKTAGRLVDYQLIAANIDVAFIVQSCDVDYNLNRLDRYIVMVKDGGIRPVLLLTKSDLVDPSRLESMVAGVERNHGIEIAALSSVTGSGYDFFRNMLEKGKTYCLIGSSGVGKSTILNHLLQDDQFLTREVREKDGRGKHTTTRRHLVLLENGALFVDTPGMRELGMINFELGMEEAFQDIADIAKGCHFKDCSHTGEKGCAVLREVESGMVPADRYQSYLKLMKESDHYGMSYLEKKQKEKTFGKLIKNYMKHDKRR